MLLKKTLNKSFFGFLIFIVFSFSDFYFVEIGRAFDYVFLACLLAYCFLARIKVAYQIAPSIHLAAILSIWLFVGMLNQHVLACLAILVGVVFVFFFFNRRNFSIEPTSIDQILEITILINALILIVQIWTFYQFGSFLDFSAMVGSLQSRGLNEGANFFRSSGLFQEPNAYCTAMFCLLSLRIVNFKSRSYVNYFGWASMLLTQSLWGFGAALVLLWLMVGTKRFMLLLVPIGISAYIYFSSLTTSSVTSFEDSVTMRRLLNINEDVSRKARYGSLENIVVDEFLLFGHGIDTSNFQTIAANALAFLLYGLGIAGITLLVVWGRVIQKIPFKHALCIVFLFTTFPLFTYMYFWAWLGLLLAFKDVKKVAHFTSTTERDGHSYQTQLPV
jgi:hypothetical protein